MVTRPSTTLAPVGNQNHADYLSVILFIIRLLTVDTRPPMHVPLVRLFLGTFLLYILVSTGELATNFGTRVVGEADTEHKKLIPSAVK